MHSISVGCVEKASPTTRCRRLQCRFCAVLVFICLFCAFIAVPICTMGDGLLHSPDRRYRSFEGKFEGRELLRIWARRAHYRGLQHRLQYSSTAMASWRRRRKLLSILAPVAAAAVYPGLPAGRVVGVPVAAGREEEAGRARSAKAVNMMKGAGPAPAGGNEYDEGAGPAVDGNYNESRCRMEDIAIVQGEMGPMPDGIPSFAVQILNLCLGGCAVQDIHVSCGWFASVTLVNPALFRRVGFDDCLVKEGQALAAGESLSFQYANSFQYPFSLASATLPPCGCPPPSSSAPDTRRPP